MKLDLVLEPDTPQRFAVLGQLAEQLGFGCVWTANHVVAPDPFMSFMPLAQQSATIAMGPVAVSPYELHPVKIANQLHTLNETSGGRARVVIGGGGGAIIAMGLKSGRRAVMPRMVRGVAECLKIIRGAGSQKAFEFKGEIFEISGYFANWVNADAPQIYIAASKPQMLGLAAREADGLMMSDVTLPRIAECMEIVNTTLDSHNRDRKKFAISNLYAWHVKSDRAAAIREARAKLFVRGMLEPWYVSPFLTPEETAFVDENLGAFANAYIKNTHVVEGVPDTLVDELVDNLTFAGDLNDVDRFIDQLIEFKAAGLTEFAIRLYGEPEEAIRLIAERVMPALQ